jgi:hypothetical protein
MRSNRRKNWFIKRIAVGLAIAALAAPVAQASVDEGIQGQPNQANEVIKPIPYRWPSSADKAVPKGIAYRPFVTDFPSSPAVRWTDPGIVWTAPAIVANPSGYQAFVSDFPRSNRDLIEVVRARPRATSSDKIEFVRTQPRSIGEPQAVAAGFDWRDAGVGAGLALALVLLGGGAALASRHVGRAQTA